MENNIVIFGKSENDKFVYINYQKKSISFKNKTFNINDISKFINQISPKLIFHKFEGNSEILKFLSSWKQNLIFLDEILPDISCYDNIIKTLNFITPYNFVFDTIFPTYNIKFCGSEIEFKDIKHIKMNNIIKKILCFDRKISIEVNDGCKIVYCDLNNDISNSNINFDTYNISNISNIIRNINPDIIIEGNPYEIMRLGFHPSRLFFYDNPKNRELFKNYGIVNFFDDNHIDLKNMSWNEINENILCPRKNNKLMMNYISQMWK